MCGITGFMDFSLQCGPDAMRANARRMADALMHRGPDDSGAWCDQGAGVGLAHRRLSILDLTPAGHQPMESRSGRFTIVFNGEIYNHQALRKELAAFEPWRGHSDTETLLAGFEAWGIEATLKRTVGMFALAVWDNAERTLTLARDRMGEKPLYYGWNQGVFLFASELKALRAYPGFDAEINRDAIALLMRHSCIPTPHSIYRGIYKLWPGTILTLRNTGRGIAPWDAADPPFKLFQGEGVSLRPYWSLLEAAEQGHARPFEGTESEAIGELERVLTEAVLAQQISDVPLGAFLSGGVDSTAIVALMQAHSSRPVKTFTIGFHEDDCNEAKYAGEIASRLGTDHTELYVSPGDSLAVIPRLPQLYDEPFSDPSHIPTFLVSLLAREHVTVSLSGDGGDELFGGYVRHTLLHRIWNNIGWCPLPMRKALSDKIRFLSPGQLQAVLRNLPFIDRVHAPVYKAYRLAELIRADSPASMYEICISHWQQDDPVVVGGQSPFHASSGRMPRQLDSFSLPEKIMLMDSVTYLPDDILVKIDRAAMGVSLETRVPFLDHRVVEFAWRLPLGLKIRGGQSKWILRQVLNRHIPKELVERPKHGFGIPLGTWLRGPLREWAEELLNESRLLREGFLDPRPVRQKWLEHVSGRRDWEFHLWDVLMFQSWLEQERRP
ncbi:asparagine synthetase [Geobacter metallireducens GS-15]|uniref:asparagine synthase (glutamine-hydrolyzing) n=1 Tax=Geobacter metallireducens (strain ATCC 53774 / DSM 7210 / GS-15) TaxID=269799 RepID=Q39TM3_GEOMG|nr:asparagine synthase (glutamine-hydrolyzing) [Geobacter metallireducens]ABB32401.1 asparagine synthetase [Geobacter metallireducens GS-15]